MIANEEAAWEIDQVLGELHIPYAIIGCLTVQYWGEARDTKDLNLRIFVPVKEQEATLRLLIERAVSYRTQTGKLVRMCSAEDLIIHKLIAGRPQDIRSWLVVFAGWPESDDVIHRFEQAWRKYGPESEQ